MSDLQAHLSEFGLAGLLMNAEDYLAIGETQERYELVEGVVMMSPTPRPVHAKIVQEILKQLSRFEDQGGVADSYSETDLQVSGSSVFRPDLVVYARKPPAKFPERLDEPPDLVVEVLSPGTKAFDLVTKKDQYEKMGVKEYWVIDPADARVRAWHQVKAHTTQLIETPIDRESLKSAGVAGFVLDIARIRRLVSGG